MMKRHACHGYLPVRGNTPARRLAQESLVLRCEIKLLGLPIRVFSAVVWTLESVRARLVTKLDNHEAMR